QSRGASEPRRSRDEYFRAPSLKVSNKLRKFKYDCNTSKLAASTRSTRQRTLEENDPQRKSSGMSEEVKAEILASIRGDISKIIREEIRGALSEDLDALKADIKAARAEIASNATTTRAEITSMKTDIEDVKSGLSTWSDEVSTLQTTVTELQSELAKLRDKCEDMEGRMRRGNIRIAGIDERPNSASPNEVSKMIKEVLKMDRDVKVDRSHRTSTSKKPRDSPRVIIAKLHNDGDAADILRRARDHAPLTYNGKRIAIFPDYTASVTKARAAFTDARKALRGRGDVRFGLLYPARFKITYKEDSKEFRDPIKLPFQLIIVSMNALFFHNGKFQEKCSTVLRLTTPLMYS
uniref:L1 transposable element RRM domain-containing protein n=1 Tax=Pygocentrus nattereri TaxID=42514 RepID=A0A3B4CHS6_PYGNA